MFLYYRRQLPPKEAAGRKWGLFREVAGVSARTDSNSALTLGPVFLFLHQHGPKWIPLLSVLKGSSLTFIDKDPASVNITLCVNHTSI